jgi:signal transduction histidine kinase/ligand-binding sensor domain-containing protein
MRRRMLQGMRNLYASCAAFALISTASAANPPRDITEYFRTQLTFAQGAPGIVQALAQTSDGFLWLGTTAAGLYRFDGVRFERVDPAGPTRLLGAGITALFAPRSGGLWIGYQYGGASFLKGNALSNYPAGDGFPVATVYSFTADLDGVVWAATSRGIARFDGQRWTDVTETLVLPSPSTRDVLADGAGNLWIVSDNKVALLRRGATRVHVYGLSVDDGLFKDPADRVWTAGNTPPCLYLLDPTRDEDPPCRPLPSAYASVWLIDQTGSLWVSETQNHLSIVPIAAKHDAPVPEVGSTSMANRRSIVFNEGQPTSALEDREGNVWFGTTTGLQQIRASRLRSYGPFEEFVVLGAGNHNSLWIGTTHLDAPPGDDFFQVKDGRMVPYRAGPTRITASYRDLTGVLWVGGYGRLWRLDDSTWQEVATPAEPKAPADPRRRTQAIARDASGALWLSVVRVGLFKLQDGKWTRVLVPGIPDTDYPLVMHADEDGSVWAGYMHGRLASFAHGAWHVYTESDGIDVGSVQVVSKVNGQIWIGGDRGVGRIREGRFETLRGLNALGGISGLVQAKTGDLWLNTSVGAVRLPQEEIRRLDADASKIAAYETFDILDGMPGIAGGGRPLPTVLESDDGRIWFDVSDYYASIDPGEHIRNTITPTVIIRSITDDGRRRAPQAPLALFPNVENVAIEYTATSLTIPSRVRFKYRLEHFEDAWQDAGTRRAAYYNNLPPGEYVFHVVAANNDGVWNNQGATVTLTVPPMFYQRVWFRALSVAAAIAAVTALFLQRLRRVTDRQRQRLEQRMEDRLSERTRIARELHDSLLQGFQGLMFRLQAVRQLLPERPRVAAEFLDSALQLGDQAICDGRDAVEDLRSSNPKEVDLATAFGALGAELAGGMQTPSTPTYHVVVEGKCREPIPEVRDDIYRIVREAVRNAYRHARAANVEVEVSFGETDLSIAVRDDGTGMDSEILARGQRPGHWGLPGMRERTASLGGQLNVWSERNAGTEIVLRVSASVAYAQSVKSPSTSLRDFFSRTD